MTHGFDRPQYVLPFVHRGSFETGQPLNADSSIPGGWVWHDKALVLADQAAVAANKTREIT
jgi:hypothetical protein